MITMSEMRSLQKFILFSLALLALYAEHVHLHKTLIPHQTLRSISASTKGEVSTLLMDRVMVIREHYMEYRVPRTGVVGDQYFSTGLAVI